MALDNYNSDLQLAHSLNAFYNRFDVHDFSVKHAEIRNSLLSAPPLNPFFDEQSVVQCLKKCKPKKSPGPDNISGHLLKTCAEQLGPIFNHIFNLSLAQQRLPSLWKQSTVVPVAKNSNPKSLNDFRPVALTSLIMKRFEKLVKMELVTKTESLLDPLQFAYRTGRGVQDATVTLLNLLYKHPEGSKNHARLLFIDFASAFNIIQPHVLVEKLESFNLDPCLVGWIFDFLTNRSQCVRVNGTLSSSLSSSTGSPQGCVLSAFLYILYTNDCRSHYNNRSIIKYADDSVIISLLDDDENGHGPIFNDFLSWCSDAFLQLNVSKTKEMCIDCRQTPQNIQSSVVNGQTVDIVTNYRYLGTIIDGKLKFDLNSDILYKKGQQRLYCLRKLAKFQVDKTLMKMFYSAYIESLICFSIICWFGNLCTRDKNSLGKIVIVASKVTGIQLDSLGQIFNRQVLLKALSICSDDTHPLNPEYIPLPSGRRLCVPHATKNRYKYSFVRLSIRALNANEK